MVADRAQAFTLEGVVAALLLVATVAFVLQVTAVSPLTTSTSSQHAERQTGTMVAGVLDAAAANESLRPALLYWNDTEGTFHGIEASEAYGGCGMPLAFGELLTRSLYDQGLACNVNVRYLAPNGDGALAPTAVRLIHGGSPSDSAVRAVRTVTLYDDDRLVDDAGTPTNTTLAGSTTFYAPDAAPNGPVYNVVQVEVVAWRT